MKKNEHCACVTPIVVMKAERKGAAGSYCARCDRPIRLKLA